MTIADERKDKIKLRLSKAMGHLNHVYKMVDSKDGMELLNQLKAVQSALDRAAEILLEHHLQELTKKTFSSSDNSESIQELLRLYRRARDL